MARSIGTEELQYMKKSLMLHNGRGLKRGSEK